MGAEPFDVRLVERRALSPWVAHLVFERIDGRPCAFAPGQWHNLFVNHPSGELKRAYSIASAPDGTARFDLTVTRVPAGPVSELLHEMEIGTQLRAVGPHGMFVREASEASASLFVGTGAGIAPLRSMMKAAIAAGSTAKLSLLFGVRNEEDILYREELEGWARELPNLSLVVTLSRPHEAWNGPHGYVQAHLARAWSDLDAPDGQVFICGLEKMVSDVKNHCRKDLGIDRKRVHQEKFD